ncbi:MAG: signal recognition particle-docking protein FtsY [Betaproteobacteria bacterium]|nr:signal recognition particle-docking protein FtsY [Betaproteobacteria bacterium]
MDFGVLSIFIAVTVFAVALAFIFGRRLGSRSQEKSLTQDKPTAPVARVGGQQAAEQRAPDIKPPASTGEESVAGAAAKHIPRFEQRSWFSRLASGLSKTQGQLVRQLEVLLLTSKEQRASREVVLDSMLEILVRADVGIRTSEMLIEKVRTALPTSEIASSEAILSVLRSEVLRILSAPAEGSQSSGAVHWSLVPQATEGTRVVLMVGVNGVGKTTTTGKIAFTQRQAGRSVIVGAADTFRAAAVDQLEEWARRAGAECVRLAEGSDPASVAFECVKKAVSQQIDLCLIDTAGRLHNRNDLMQELSKIRRVTSKDVPGAPHEVLLVLDATTGQNALQQARAFKEIAGVTGLVLTKLDGTAKGGVAIALAAEMNLPIRYIGVGESVEDLQPFSAEEFVDALFSPAVSPLQQAPALQPMQS